MSASKITPRSVLTAPIRLALFDARVTAPLLVALLYYPEKLRDLLPERVRHLVRSQALIRALSVFLGLSVLRGINKKLSQWTANNWKSDAKFVKSQELVLISGGCSGIGKFIAEGFAKRGVKVVILDLNHPKTTLRESAGLSTSISADGIKHLASTSTSATLPPPPTLLPPQHRSAKSMATRRC
jgi:all-trans-retinol dehydrogenase (NAD+)